MNENEQVKQAREQLQISIKNVKRDLKIYGKAVANRNTAVIKNLSNNLIDSFKKFKNEIEELKKEKEKQKEIVLADRLQEKELQRRTAEHKAGMTSALLKNDIEQGLLKVKDGAKEKVSSAKSKFNKISNSLFTLLGNTDVKIRNAFEKAQISGLEFVNSSLNSVDNAKNSVIKITNEQMNKYNDWRKSKQEQHFEKEEQKRLEREEKERQKEIVLADRLQEKELQRRTAEHKAEMKSVLNEAERKEYDEEYIKLHKRKNSLIEELKFMRNKLFNSTIIHDNEEIDNKKSR